MASGERRRTGRSCPVPDATCSSDLMASSAPRTPTGATTYLETPAPEIEADRLPTDLPGTTATFTTAPFATRFEMIGMPTLDVWVELLVPDSHITARLEVIDADGNRLMPEARTIGARSAQHLDPIVGQRFQQRTSNLAPTGEPLLVRLRFDPIDLVVPAGARLRLTIAGSSIVYDGLDGVTEGLGCGVSGPGDTFAGGPAGDHPPRRCASRARCTSRFPKPARCCSTCASEPARRRARFVECRTGPGRLGRPRGTGAGTRNAAINGRQPDDDRARRTAGGRGTHSAGQEPGRPSREQQTNEACEVPLECCARSPFSAHWRSSCPRRARPSRRSPGAFAFVMSDGVELEVRLGGRGPLVGGELPPRPVIVEFSPYAPGCCFEAAGPDYNYLQVHIRGTGLSDGLVRRARAAAASRTSPRCSAWACRQPWSNGRLGLLGFSASAIIVYNSLHLDLPCVEAAVLGSGTHELYRDLLYPGGVSNGIPAVGVFGLIGAPLVQALPDRFGRDPLSLVRSPWAWASCRSTTRRIRPSTRSGASAASAATSTTSRS